MASIKAHRYVGTVDNSTSLKIYDCEMVRLLTWYCAAKF